MRGRQRRQAFKKQCKADIAWIHHCRFHGKIALSYNMTDSAHKWAIQAGARASFMAHRAFTLYPELRENKQ